MSRNMIQRRNMNIGIMAAIILIVGVVGASVLQPAHVTAQGSNLSQRIEELDCSHNTYSTGVGQTNNVECDIFMPRMTSYELADENQSSSLILYGAYDAVHAYVDPATATRALKLEFGGHIFVLGVESEFTADGNGWKLDLSRWNDTHSDGEALIFVAGYGYNGKITSILVSNNEGVDTQVAYSANFTVKIPQKTPAEPTNEPKSDGIISPDTGLWGIMRGSWPTVVIPIVFSVIFVIYIIFIISRRNKK